jgi:hypothetical protein
MSTVPSRSQRNALRPFRAGVDADLGPFDLLEGDRTSPLAHEVFAGPQQLHELRQFFVHIEQQDRARLALRRHDQRQAHLSLRNRDELIQRQADLLLDLLPGVLQRRRDIADQRLDLLVFQDAADGRLLEPLAQDLRIADPDESQRLLGQEIRRLRPLGTHFGERAQEEGQSDRRNPQGISVFHLR